MQPAAAAPHSRPPPAPPLPRPWRSTLSSFPFAALEQAEIRKAYMKLALALHPDKNPGDASAVDKFQTLQKVYGILSDEDK